MKTYLTVRMASVQLGVSKSTVRRLCSHGELAFDLGRGGDRRISPISVEDYLRRAPRAGILVQVASAFVGRAAELDCQLRDVERVLLRGLVAGYENWNGTRREKFDVNQLLTAFERQEEKLDELWDLLQYVDVAAAGAWRPTIASLNESIEQVRRLYQGVTP